MQVADEGVNAASKPKFIQLNREQSYWGEIDLESLIEADHPARAVWALTGRLDLSSFEEGIRSREGTAGAPRHSPRLLVSVWVYAYSQGIASARALERMMSYEPGLRWLGADDPINYHTLSDFRSSQKEKLNDLFAKVLAVMDEEGLIDLGTLMQDGTKVRAVASKSSFHRAGTLRSKCEQARALVEELEKQSEKDSGGNEEKRRTAARRRAAQVRLQRMESWLEKLKVRQESVAPGKRDQVCVSDSEPEARKMLQTEGGFAPSYNVQITTEAKSKMVVGIGVVNEANDTHQLLPARIECESNTERNRSRSLPMAGMRRGRMWRRPKAGRYSWWRPGRTMRAGKLAQERRTNWTRSLRRRSSRSWQRVRSYSARRATRWCQSSRASITGRPTWFTRHSRSTVLPACIGSVVSKMMNRPGVWNECARATR